MFAPLGAMRQQGSFQMARIVVNNHLTLDGVMQAPARPDEDRRGGFAHGGWAAANADAVMGRVMGERMGGGGAGEGGGILLGRRTYEDLASVWPHMPDDNPYAPVINARRKYVVSSTLRAPLQWNNSVLLEGDPVHAVAQLKAEATADIVILGSGELVRALMPAGLIDEYLLCIHPLVVGPGVRLFTDDGAFAALALVDATTTTAGVVIATYRPADAAA
jgi:dihydrofolate reductase